MGDEFVNVVRGWVSELKETYYFSETDPLFPKTKVSQDCNNSFVSDGIQADFWANASPIRQIFKKSFLAAGIEYYNPHSFRNTLVHFGQKRCKSPEHFKAWSQSLGHESPLATFTSYGNIDPIRRGEKIGSLGGCEIDDISNSDLLVSIKSMIEGKG